MTRVPIRSSVDKLNAESVLFNLVKSPLVYWEALLLAYACLLPEVLARNCSRSDSTYS